MSGDTFSFDQQLLAQLCRRNGIARLEMFGSRARGTARPGSDVDLLVTFAPGRTPGIEFFGMAEEFAVIFGHPVDLITRRTVEEDRNAVFRENVLSGAQVLYAA